MEEAAPAVELERVFARYGPTGDPALVGVSLVARAGDVVALLGSNGAGKSTLLRLVAGLVAPSNGKDEHEGTARLFGTDLRLLGRRQIAQQVALVPQSAPMPEGFRVRDVVAMGRAPRQSGWMRESDADRTAVDHALARCDLQRLADRSVDTLSGGQQRRVAIARALAQEPRVLCLDEPAAFLDIRYRRELYAWLAELAARDRVTCLVAMHDLDAARRIANRAVLLRAGRLVAAGATHDVLTSKLLTATFDTPIDTLASSVL